MCHKLQSEIESGLLKLGIKSGMMLEVHCSLSSLGFVEDGAVTVIQALKNTVGTDGAVVMPSFKLSPNISLSENDKKLGLTQKIKILKNENDENEKSAMGIVADTFKKMPDVITGEGIFRVSAWGKDADKHSCGLQHLIDSNGYALLIGVDIYRLSAMHYVEDVFPDEIKSKFTPSDEARKIYPEDEWFIESWTPSVRPWYKIQERAYRKGFITDGMIGNSKCMLVQVKHTISLYRQALINEPFELYGIEKKQTSR